MNASPTTNTSALINSAIDLGIEIVEAPVGAGMLIVQGTVAAVREWMNEAPGMFVDFGNGMANACRVVHG